MHSHDHYVSDSHRQLVQLIASWDNFRVPLCHCTRWGLSKHLLPRNLEAPDLQGSEQNMDSLPLSHRSIAICNPPIPSFP